MPYSMPLADARHITNATDQQVMALQDALARIAAQNSDPGLQGLISDAAGRCQMLRRTLDLRGPNTGWQESAVDAQVFERLMALAGPVTAVELLDQLLVDLRAVAGKLASPPDLPIIQGQCHILIAVAGAVGARRVQTDAECLHEAAHRSDMAAVDQLIPGVLIRLAALIAFVAAERAVRHAT